MHQHRQRGDYAQAQVRHECRSYQNSIAKSMYAVTGQHGPATTFSFGMVMVVMNVTMAVATAATMLMPVVPQLGFVEQKEKHQSCQQGSKQIMRAGLAFKRLG